MIVDTITVANCRIDQLEADVANKGTPRTAPEPGPVGSEQQQAGAVSEALAERLKEVESRERTLREQQAKDKEAKGREGQERQALKLKVGSSFLSGWSCCYEQCTLLVYGGISDYGLV